MMGGRFDFEAGVFLKTRWRVIAAWLVFTGLLAGLTPGRVIVRGDDFGYVESAALTIKAGVLTQSDWLGPYNMPLPLVCSVINAVTHSFWLATHGLLIALGLLNFLLLQRWLALNGIKGSMAALAVAVCPWWLNKAVEFTGVALGLGFFLGALLAWRAGKRLLFFVLLAAGIANRQSMVCLLVFPACELIRVWRKERKIDRMSLAGALAAGAVFLTLERIYPATYAREWVAKGLARNFSFATLAGNLGLGLVIMLGIKAVWRWKRRVWTGGGRAGLGRGVCGLAAWIRNPEGGADRGLREGAAGRRSFRGPAL